MINYRGIYQNRASDYDRLVAREDYQGNILPALAAVRPLEGLTVVELGAGTGRLTRLLLPHVKRILAIDASASMLSIAQDWLSAEDHTNWAVAAADNRELPVVSQFADLALAGWSLGHFVNWFPDSWPQEVDRTVKEMRRVLRPGGTAVILETLGTGRETPQPPGQGLAGYYRRLENELGFVSIWIRTDYRFRSSAEAASLTRFFFGDALADKVAKEERTVVPECTGIWWLAPESRGGP